MANTYSLDLELTSSQHAWAADSAPLSFTGDFTIECWIKLEQLPSTATTDFTLVSKFDAITGATRSWEVSLQNTDKLRVLYSGDGTNVTSIISTNAIVTAGDVGNWIHISAAVDVSAKTAAVYKNGASQTMDAATGTQTSVADTATRVGVGARNPVVGAGNFFDGCIDEVRIWDDIRSEAEVTANYQKELVGNETNLQGYWKLNNDYEDATANNNDLTAVGSPVFSTSVPFTEAAGGFFALL